MTIKGGGISMSVAYVGLFSHVLNFSCFCCFVATVQYRSLYSLIMSSTGKGKALACMSS
jgi:hypothetical protein